MDDDAVEFFFIGGGLLFGVGSDCVETDEEVARNGVFVTHHFFVFAIVEGDNVCIVVMLEILSVDFQYLFVVAEDVGYAAHFLAV